MALALSMALMTNKTSAVGLRFFNVKRLEVFVLRDGLKLFPVQFRYFRAGNPTGCRPSLL